ncbi:MAG: copper chaperone PCu(A)C [Mesorhizobium sp.]|jgi:copper(I)-binding protein|nr:copper chaperone PCu(A)C [Mesorhizobium sp.]MBL8579236.1 copper chaperone PCu(A)C [Mesorhizobium sp.]
MKKVLLALLAVVIATPVVAQTYSAGAVGIDNTWIQEAPPRAPTLAGFVTFENTGAEDDRLVAIESAAVERVELHKSVVTDGIARMSPMENGLALPAGQTITLGENGTHAMFINPLQRYRDGEEIAATLILEKAGRVDVNFTVRKRPAAGAMPESDGMTMDDGMMMDGEGAANGQ